MITYRIEVTDHEVTIDPPIGYLVTIATLDRMEGAWLCNAREGVMQVETLTEAIGIGIEWILDVPHFDSVQVVIDGLVRVTQEGTADAPRSN